MYNIEGVKLTFKRVVMKGCSFDKVFFGVASSMVIRLVKIAS